MPIDDGCGCSEDSLCDYHWGVEFGRSLLDAADQQNQED